MSIPLRIHHNGEDYTYIIQTKRIDKDSSNISILLNGEEFTLQKDERGKWYAYEMSIGDKTSLIEAITRNVTLRFRL